VKIGSLVVAAIAVVAVVLAVPSLAFAQGPANPGNPGTPTGPGGPMGSGQGNGWMAQYRDEMHAAIAKALGLSVEEFDAARASGQTVWQIAETQGVSVETLQAAMQTARANVLAQAVADGTLTQAQADTMLARMNARTAQGGGWSMGRGNGQQGGYAGNCPYANN
jgi:predicted DNA-binding protein (UPF0251 family)